MTAAALSPVLDLPLRVPRTAGPRGGTARHEVSIPPGMIAQLAEAGCEPGAGLLAGYAAMLARYTGQPRLPILAAVGASAQAVIAEVQPHTTLAELADSLAKQLEAGAATATDTASPAEPASRYSAGYEFRAGEAGGTLDPATVEFGMTIHGDQLRISYDAELLESDLVARFARHYLRLVGVAAAAPREPMSAMEVIGAEDHQLLASWGTATDVAVPLRPVPELVAEQARQRPEAVALTAAVDGDRVSLTYGELDGRANQLADRMRAGGVRAGDLVALWLPRSVELVVAALATHRCGAAALMLDPKGPADYLSRVLARATPRALLTVARLGRSLPDEPELRVCVDQELADPAAAKSFDPHSPSLDEVAFYVQTSGSTGEPKLVAATHRGVAHAALTQVVAHGVSQADQGAWTFPPHTTVSVGVVVWPFLAVGATLHIASDDDLDPPERLRDWLVDHHVTQCFVIASIAEALVGVAWPRRPALSVLLTGSDRVRGWAGKDLPFEVGNWYGTNEANIVTTSIYPWQERLTSATASGTDRLAPPPIGRPWPGVRAYVVDSDLRPVPPGVIGELAVTSPQLTRGYLGAAAQTAERYLPDPFGDDPGGRLYLTGDLVRFRTDGFLEHHGRVDQQVKIAGMRVETTEVEQVLLAHSQVREAAVHAPVDPSGQPRLIGYVVPAGELELPRLREYLAERLPVHMVPAGFVTMEALPRNANDKIDRQSLPVPDWSAPGAAPGRQQDATDELERAVADAFAVVLDRESVGRQDSFLLLGGDSLGATRVRGLLQDQLGVEITARDLLLHPTPEELATRIRERVG